MDPSELPSLDGPGSNANDLMTWLQQRQEKDLVPSAQALFEKILETASQPRSATKDACVKLCGFVQLCAKSKQEPVRQWAFRDQTARDLFDYYLEWNEKDQHRSMRLVLDIVSTLIMKNPNAQVRELLKADFLSVLVSIISKRSVRPVVKSCISSLTQFLTKSVFTLDDLARQYGSVRPDLAGEPTVTLWQEWVIEIFNWMELHYICPVAGKFLVIVFSNLFRKDSVADSGRTNSTGFDISILRQWLEAAISDNLDNLENVKNYLLANMFKSDRGLSIALLKELSRRGPEQRTSGADEDVTALLHLAALEIGKKSSIVDEPSPIGTEAAANVVILDQEVLERFLVHTSHEVRSFAISLLIVSSSTTKPYSPMAFQLLKRHLKSCHADPDAKFRNEVLAHAKNMVKRIQGAISVLRKDISRLAIKTSKADTINRTSVNTHISKGAKQIANAGETWLRDCLQAHEGFLSWYLEFLRQELVPTASYQRHITALKSLVNVLRLGGECPSSVEQRIYQDPQWFRIVMDLVMDPFDDVRETATGLLMLFPSEAIRTQLSSGAGKPQMTPLDILTEFCTRAADIASRTSRADHSDGAARSLGLLCAWQDTLAKRVLLVSRTLDELEKKIAMAEKDLGFAVMSVPVHGTFAAIRYTWEVLSEQRYSADELRLLAKPQLRAVALSARIWDAVSHVLCDDSPEGRLPEELEEIEGLDTKGLLSYSFRAIHESSNLMRTIVGNLKFSHVAGYLVPPAEVFRSVGNLAFSQLSSLRHRGAFSSVSLTFTCCCQHAQNPAVASSPDERPLLEIWYQGTLSCIKMQRSTTRRSAGIPALMTGILASNADSPSFQEVMRTLQDIAAAPARVSETDGSNLPQVHAFNCIKEVFKSSLLSNDAEMYLAECLQLATTSLKSEVWAIRNCALLLLRSLIDTLFGTTESKSSMEMGWDGKTLRLSYTKYSTLPPILLNLLKSGEQAMEPSTLAQSSAAESVFPALEIIRRAGPPESHRDELYKYITRYLGSRQWHVREIAARTLCSFLLSGDWLAAAESLLEGTRGSANRLHGTLLAIKFFLERTLIDLIDEQTINDMNTLGLILKGFENDALMCSETAAAYVDVHSLLWKEKPSEGPASDLTHLSRATDKRRKSSRFMSAALLDNRIGTLAVRKAAASANVDALKTCLLDALGKDMDTACAHLEALPSIWDKRQVSQLCGLYLDVCRHTSVPEARAMALVNLAELMDEAISNDQVQHLPGSDELDKFQLSFQGVVNPTLANAILLASGPIMAVRTLQHHGQMSFFTFEQHLRSWGKAIADSLHDSNTFDMRIAAARSLKPLATALRSDVGSDAAYIPFLLALYTTLVDDDEEVRAVGAVTAAFVMSERGTKSQPLVAVDAADALLAWTQDHFGQTNEFRAYIACRLVGEQLVAVDIGVQDLSAWASPETQFTEALMVDDSLFAIEEQNLFIDKVRETERWAGLFEGLEWDFDEIQQDDGTVKRLLMMDSALSALKSWTETALRCLAEQATKEDGPLGWASNPNAFALCHRVLVCGRMLSKLLDSEDKTYARLLGQIQEAGQSSRLHGLLLSTLREPAGQ